MHHRQRLRHDLVLRALQVTEIRDLTPTLRRVTVTGDDLEGFAAPGPADHVKILLPDADGVIHAPIQGADGRLQRPDRAISRDYTPRAYRPSQGVDSPHELDLDFVLHEGGPASDWARSAVPGASIVVAGPRGSRLAPDDIERAVLIADPTSLPALARWLESLPEHTVIDVILWGTATDDIAYLDDRLRARIAGFTWLDILSEPADLLDAVRALRLQPGAFVWAAGEAAALIPVRRYLRSLPELDHADIDVQGYWKRGVVALDHHAPIDPDDPDEG